MTQNPQDQPVEGGQQPYSERPYAGQPPPPPPAPGYGQPVYSQAGPVSPSDARLWAMFAQLGGFLTSFVAPLVIYLIYRDRDPFIRRHAAQALNFQIIALIAYVISSILVIVLIGIPMLLALAVCWIVFPILAAIAANKGEEYTYPFIPQLVS